MEAKKAVETAEKREKKIREEYDTKFYKLTDVLAIAKEANWLYEKFDDGTYTDIFVLCKVANKAEIETNGWLLTP